LIIDYKVRERYMTHYVRWIDVSARCAAVMDMVNYPNPDKPQVNLNL